jgi:hypothetical protein
MSLEDTIKPFLAPTGAQEVTLSVCLSIPFIILHSIFMQSLSSLLAVS